jgi:alpha-mannosidase
LDSVRRAAYSLTRPLVWRRENAHSGRLPSQLSIANAGDPGVLVETVKWAEDEEALIVRLYEADGGAARATLNLGLDPGSVAEVDLLERNPRPLPQSARNVALELRAREIKTLAVTS